MAPTRKSCNHCNFSCKTSVRLEVGVSWSCCGHKYLLRTAASAEFEVVPRRYLERSLVLGRSPTLALMRYEVLYCTNKEQTTQRRSSRPPCLIPPLVPSTSRFRSNWFSWVRHGNFESHPLGSPTFDIKGEAAVGKSSVVLRFVCSSTLSPLKFQYKFYLGLKRISSQQGTYHWRRIPYPEVST